MHSLPLTARLCAAALALCFAALSAPRASAQTTNQDVYAVTYENDSTRAQLIRFNRSTPGNVTVIGEVSKSFCPNRISGLDYRPATRELYGICGTNLIIRLDPATAAASSVGSPGSIGSGDFLIGTDFDPVADQYRVVSSAGNRRVNPADGTLIATDTSLTFAPGDPNSGSIAIQAIAYSNNAAGASQTTLYAIDRTRDILVTIGTANGAESPNTGLVHTVGSLGVDIGGLTNFDIAPDGTALLEANNTTDGTRGQLYTVNLSTGAATLVGNISNPLSLQDGTTIGGYAGIAVVTEPVCAAPPSGMVAWYPGDGNAKDIQGGNNGTPQKGAAYAAGKVGQAFSFDGVDDNVVAPDTPALDPQGAITVDAWIDPTSLPAAGQYYDIVGKDGETAERQYLLNMTSSGHIRAHVGTTAFQNNGGFAAVDGATQIPANAWTHVAMTYDGATLSLYVNGHLDGSLAVTGSVITTPQPLRIGGGAPQGEPQYFFPGQIDEVEVFNRALTAAEVQSIYNADTAGKCKPAGAGGELLISEFRLRGPAGANDEFIEVYNATAAPLTVGANDGSAGYAVAASDGVIRCTIPNGAVIPARGHFLCANNGAGGYSLAAYAAGDALYTTDITDNAGVALFNTANPSNFSAARRFDAAGSTAETNFLYKEGAGYPALAAAAKEQSFYRSLCSFVGGVGCTTPGVPKDTDDNASDFLYVATDGSDQGAGARLGAPGPENLSSPVQRNATIALDLLDRTKSASATPNRERSFTADAANNSTFGTLTIRRRVTNNTGAAVTRLRYRIIEVTTYPAPNGSTADLRARTSMDTVVTNVGDAATCGAEGLAAPCAVTVRGTALEAPPAQPNGGGLNSTLSVPAVTSAVVTTAPRTAPARGVRASTSKLAAPTLSSGDVITLGQPLASGASVNVQFLLGIQQTGTFRFYVNVEALP